ncbi:MAG: hypothetical protein FWE95_05055 [Planctomycetaceae bacterium]|nr:hypothetical protein [Planctomycetaceae bacterium]
MKDREGRTLDFNDIVHCPKIICVLNETEKLMRKVNLLMRQK